MQKPTTLEEELPLTKINPRPLGYSMWRAGHGVSVIDHDNLIIMGLVDCDEGPYQCISLLMNEDKTLYHVLGGKKTDFNTILFSGTDQRQAEKYFYHTASRYLE